MKTCGSCGKQYKGDRDETETRVEYDLLYPELSHDRCGSMCHPCFKLFLPWYYCRPMSWHNAARAEEGLPPIESLPPLSEAAHASGVTLNWLTKAVEREKELNALFDAQTEVWEIMGQKNEYDEPNKTHLIKVIRFGSGKYYVRFEDGGRITELPDYLRRYAA